MTPAPPFRTPAAPDTSSPDTPFSRHPLLPTPGLGSPGHDGSIDAGPHDNRWLAQGVVRGPTYDERWARMAAEGRNVHGEADFVEGLGPGSVLDAGCGTGRVAVELARRGIEVVGVDLDPSMLAVAREKAPGLTWVAGDLATVDLDRSFDLVVLAGNVMIFLAPGTEAAVVANMAQHVGPGGALVAGFQLQPGRLSLGDYDAHCRAAGVVAEQRWATWQAEPFGSGDYVVTVHRRRRGSGSESGATSPGDAL